MNRPDYGQDSPGVVRGLAIAGTVIAIATLASPVIPRKFGIHFTLWPAAVALLGTALWMVWSSRIGKRRKVRALLDLYAWRGDEAVLDIGCGRGLATIAAAQRLRSGHVTGIDLWRGQDLGGNAPKAAQMNADLSGVASRVSFQTGDATDLPFPDASFDVAVSMTVLHNIPSAAGRSRAIHEALRVLRPGGTLLIFDILHTRNYSVTARSAGAARVWLSNPDFLWALPGWMMTASKPLSVNPPS